MRERSSVRGAGEMLVVIGSRDPSWVECAGRQTSAHNVAGAARPSSVAETASATGPADSANCRFSHAPRQARACYITRMKGSRKTLFALAVIVLAQFLGTSLWFSGNAAAVELAGIWKLDEAQRGWLLMAVQLGFIAGTLAISLSGLADAFPSSQIFTMAALFGALANAAFALWSRNLLDAIALRFLTGLALAGIYPLGMKLVVTWAPRQSGAALGWLVGALTLGTALPHLIRGLGTSWNWQVVVLTASVLAGAPPVVVAVAGDAPPKPEPL